MAGTDYAKFVEVGTRQRYKKGRWMYRKTQRKAARLFGKGFIIEHKMIQPSEIPFDRKSETQQYYNHRWKISFPGILIKIKRGVNLL